MIGFYDYTLILTLGSLVSACIGIALAMGGKVKTAILCIIISGICDGFDGKVARTKKNRTEDEKSFGIQLDSMCDMMAFCALPITICLAANHLSLLSVIAVCFYGICSVIRLSFYNMKEVNRMYVDTHAEKIYFGLPITSIAMTMPFLLLMEAFLAKEIFPVTFAILLIVEGFCFILNFQIHNSGKLVVKGAIAAIVILLLSLFVFSGFLGSGAGLGDFLGQCFAQIP